MGSDWPTKLSFLKSFLSSNPPMFSNALKIKSKLPMMCYMTLTPTPSLCLSLMLQTHGQSLPPPGAFTTSFSLSGALFPSASPDFSAPASQLKGQRGQPHSSFLHSQFYCINFLTFFSLYVSWLYEISISKLFIVSYYSCYHKNAKLRNTYVFSPLLTTVYPKLRAELDIG